MSGRRESGFHSESFNVRWHSVVDATTPSADIMSSPDPLNDTPISNVLFSSARRVTRSQRSDRFLSLEGSPRKRTFALQVGDNKSPQKLFVTVETEDGSPVAGPRRKLFQPSSPTSTKRSRGRSTTTIVPLRDETPSDTGDLLMTPRRRGPARKSNGTPMPSAGRKRRAGTPINRTPRRPRTTPSNGHDDDAASEASTQTTQNTPRSTKRRGRPPKNVATEPPSELSVASVQSSTSTKRTRRRRQALAPEELGELADEAAGVQSVQESLLHTEDEMDLLHAPSESLGATPRSRARSASGAGSDIWMATMSNEATPKAIDYTSRLTRAASPPGLDPTSLKAQQNPETLPEPEAENTLEEPNDYGYFATAASDISSADEHSLDLEPRNDTIAQGEDFSMIFMDSIPSLQADFKSSIPPTAQEDLGDETNLIINNTLEYLRQSGSGAPPTGTEAVDSIEHSPIMSPREEPTAQEDLSSRQTNPPSPIRELASRLSRSPRKAATSSPLRHRVLKFTARQTEGLIHDALENVNDSQAPNSSRRRSSVPYNEEDSNLYEDSFSEIPQDILNAATPRRPVANPVEEYDELEEMDAEGGNLSPLAEHASDQQVDVIEALEAGVREAEIEELEAKVLEAQEDPGAPSNTSTAAQSEASRLPTPDDTPPQVLIEADESLNKSPLSRVLSPAQLLYQSREESAEVSESPAHLEEPVLPPTITIGSSSKEAEATPLNQVSSPLQEPQSLLPEPLHERAPRLLLSPIVRAGRVLQSVTSDPPSPEGRERQLGSPFRSSGSKESWLGSKDSQNSRLISKSPPAPIMNNQLSTKAGSQAHDNPFNSSTAGNGQTGFMAALKNANETIQTSELQSRVPAPSSLRITPPSDGVMSWVEDAGPISPNLRGDNSLREASRSSSTKAAKGSFSRGQVDGTADEEEDEVEQIEVDDLEDGQQVQDDETDIWDIEASRETPRSTRQRPFGTKKSAPSTHRRRAIPSSWTKTNSLNSRYATGAPGTPIAAGALENLASNLETTPSAAPVETEEYSMLEQGGTLMEPQSKNEKGLESATKASRFDLSSFFSSPAAIPGMLVSTFLPARARSLLESKPNQADSVEATAALPTSSMFPQVSQTELDSKSSPEKKLSSTRLIQSPIETTEVRSSSPETPERLDMPIVAQKQNFTPRPRQTSHAFFQPSSARSAVVTPPRMQLSHADIHRWQQETSNASEDSPDLSRRLLRPLPPKNASPTKSSLRSPLKPHTPGRVVEFTSSVLSPAEQANARHQRQAFNSSLFQEHPVLVEPGTTAQMVVADKDKEYQQASDADVTMSDASPLITKSFQPNLLSQTMWTREHWLFLDELLQLRRQAPFGASYERRAEKYLDKTVKSQGEAMTLERWHLDCVDAFKAEVGGWDEGILAKRLFALIVGEERRGQEVAAGSSSAMFH